MTDKEFAEFQYKIAYYEELLLKRYSTRTERSMLIKMESKLDEWYFHGMSMSQQECDNHALVM